MTAQEIKDLSAGVQSLAFMVAILVGGVWALVRFCKLRSTKKAQAELDLAERALIRRAVPSINMKPSQVTDPDTSQHFILVDVEIRNHGNRTEVLDPAETLVHAAKVNINADGKTTLGHIGRASFTNPDPTINITSHAVEPGSILRLSFLLPVTDVGIYHLSFRAKASPVEMAELIHEQSCLNRNPQVAWWTAFTYCTVRPLMTEQKPRVYQMAKIGILAYGSLIEDPGDELRPYIVDRVTNVTTPFKIEFTRKSRTRGNAPTVIPIESGGSQVNATILVLKEGTEIEKAKDLLWRRETRNQDPNRHYEHPNNPSKNHVIIESTSEFKGFESVIYTRIGKNIDNPKAETLAKLAINSAKSKAVDEGKDGITYLMSIKRQGIVTPIMEEYEKEILKQTQTKSLEAAINKIKK